jgi:signal transduction histidine kinase
MEPGVKASYKHVRLNTALAAVFWTVFIGLSLAWNAYQHHKGVMEFARIQAEANLNKDIAFRRWATEHGGVYVRPSQKWPADKYLTLPDRDVLTTKGMQLTLINPAYMMRQIMEGYAEQYGVKGHITGLSPINPMNMPDEWERKVLESFAMGANHAAETSEIEGKPHLRVMLPMYLEGGCLKCHVAGGSEQANVQGGVSVSVPLAPFEAAAMQELRITLGTHGGIWLVGMAGIVAVSRRAMQRVAERERARSEISELNASLERRVAERTADLERANRELEAFSYTVSHDLRAPLRAINGFAHLLLEGEGERLSGEGKRMFGRIVHNSNRLGELIDDVLEYSRAGRIALVPAGVDFESLAHSVAHELLESYPDATVDVARLPRVQGDETMLRQVLVNLVGNALKFSTGSPRPRVEIGMQEGDGRRVYYVRDNGVGFDMNYAGKLFGMFQRIHTGEQFPGTGVGLAIVQRLVERHGGEVWAEATPGCGATFYFTLGPEKP